MSWRIILLGVLGVVFCACGAEDCGVYQHNIAGRINQKRLRGLTFLKIEIVML